MRAGGGQSDIARRAGCLPVDRTPFEMSRYPYKKWGELMGEYRGAAGTYSYEAVPLPFNSRQIEPDVNVAVSESGDHVFLSQQELMGLVHDAGRLPLELQAELRSKFFLGNGSAGGKRRLLDSRIQAKRETVRGGPSLHIIVPTLQCAHSCQYCQVSRALTDVGHTISIDDLNAACDSIFQSDAQTLTVEFQGGDPLLRFDLVAHAIERIQARNATQGRTIRFVIASTLHQLTEEMCSFFATHSVFLSTSIDGPAHLHNKNRPTPGRDAHERTWSGIQLARQTMGAHTVSALMTTTKASLAYPEEIVDEYVRLGSHEIFLRPLSTYGFAKRNQSLLGYSLEQFQQFYRRALDRILHWNRQGVPLREVYASIILNKILWTFDAGFVDLQSPTGAGQSVLVYNYDGHVYPSDEARMLAETGDKTLRLGRIGEPLSQLRRSEVQLALIQASVTDNSPACQGCAYSNFCSPNPVDAQAQFGSMFVPAEDTEHCRRHLWLFDAFFSLLRDADDHLLDLFYHWARPVASEEFQCAA